VSSGSGYSTPDMSQPGTQITYDGLGRTLTVKQPNSAMTTISYSAACNAPGLNDTSCYSETTTIDANSHQQTSFADAQGQDFYDQDWTGTGPYTSYRVIRKQYDYLGNVVNTRYGDGSHTATATYDDLNRLTAMSDPDLGSWTYSYDANGNKTASVDPRGSSGTVYTGYDGLNRVLWESNQGNGSNPYASDTYDSTANGNDGIGHLTSETFASGPSQGITGSYAYTYDARGQQTGWSMTINSTAYPFTLGYNDAGQQTSLTYPDGDTLTTSYSSQDWLAGATEKLGSSTTTLLNSIGYSGAAGAAQLMTSGSVGNSTYAWALSYDTLNRLNETKVTASGTTLFDQTRSFDAVGNVWNTLTTLQAGTDNQAFCYDEQNRLIWAGAEGTPPCQGLTEGSLTSAAYQQSYAYDVLDRLTTGPSGSGYTYGDSSHLDAVTSTGSSYTASYDAAGNMLCRAPNSSLTCSGTPTGQQIGYDALRRQISWQDATNAPSTTAAYAYDGSGERVEQQVTSGGTTTTTLYIGTCEEVSITGSQTTTTKYYKADTLFVEAVNGMLYYLVGDDLGSVAMTLTSSGSVQATQLYAPYGAVRYSNGTMPTSYGFTHQRIDPSGLLYFHARYYDAKLGQYISADTVQGPNRYGYVGGNPETTTDPTGQWYHPPVFVGGSENDPQPSVFYPNYHDYLEKNWQSDFCHVALGRGCYIDLMFEDLNYYPDDVEYEDGELLAAYFGITIVHPVERKDQKNPDYLIGISYLVGDQQFFDNDHAQSADLYTPAANTNWNAIKTTAQKKAGDGQAGIIVIDLRNIKGWDLNSLLSLQARIFSNPSKNVASSVRRIIFIGDGTIQGDFQNPRFSDYFGPEPHGSIPPVNIA
jgi:RHS repeat-associated protein